MRSSLSPLLAVVAAVALARPVAADEAESYAKHVEAKSASVVAVKFVRKVGSSEQNVNEVGTLVDASGVVMLRAGALRSMFPGAPKATVSNLRVIFPGDEKEYEAIVGATDSNLGLGFVRIRDLQGKKAVPVDLSDPAEPTLGAEAFAVSRLDQGFDHAPYFGTARVAGHVTKPRSMWLLTGFAPLAHVLYAADGRACGVMIQQSGVSDGDDFSSFRRVFLLPMKTALPTIRQAIQASETALAEDVARAKAAAEEAAAGAPPAPPADPAPKEGPPK